MDKFVQNNHKAHIRCSKSRLVLNPGPNRLSEEQYKAILQEKTIKSYFKIQLLQNIKAPESAGAKGSSTSQDDRLVRMGKEELAQLAKKHRVGSSDSSREELINLLSSKLSPSTPPNPTESNEGEKGKLKDNK